MKERPILFNAEMVRAVLAGTKTMTRRVVKPQPIHDETAWAWYGEPINAWKIGEDPPDDILRGCPYGVPGDRLWVREAWRVEREVDHMSTSDLPDYGHYAVDYQADGGTTEWAGKTRLPVNMPRWASRIDLVVTAVRVERVRDISDADAVSEGIAQERVEKVRAWFDPRNAHRHAFGELWDSIYDERGYPWKSNPWVWVVEFRRVA